MAFIKLYMPKVPTFKPQPELWPEGFEHKRSAVSNADDPEVAVEEAFVLHNEYKAFGLRSASVGDVFVVDNNHAYIVDYFGFLKIETKRP